MYSFGNRFTHVMFCSCIESESGAQILNFVSNFHFVVIVSDSGGS